MANKVRHTLHRRSSVNTPKTINIERGTLDIKNPKAPIPDNIEFGEIAINYGKDSESLFIKNSDGKVIRLNSISNIKYDGDVDKSLAKYLDDRYVNRSGDTMYGDFTIKEDRKGDDPKFKYIGSNFAVSAQTSTISGTNLNVIENISDIKSSQTKVSGTNLTINEIGTTKINNKNTIFSGETVDYDAERTDISGNTLIVNEKESSISGDNLTIKETDTATLSGTNLVIKEINTDFDGSDFDADINNVNLSGNTFEIDGKNSILIKNSDASNQGKGFIKIQTPNLDVDSIKSTLDGEELSLNETKNVNVNSANVNVTGTSTTMQGDNLNVTYKNLNKDITVKEDVNINELAADITNGIVSGNTLKVDEETKAELNSHEISVSGITTNLKGTEYNSDYKTSVGFVAPTVKTTASKQVKLDTAKYDLSGTTTNMKGTKLTAEYDNINLVGNIGFNGNVTVENNLNVSGDTRLGNGNSTKIEVPNENYPSVSDAPEFRLNDCIGKQIKVIGVQIGNYQKPNEKIPVGTTLEEILYNMLWKNIGVEKHLPTVHIDNAGTDSDIYEVGTTINTDLSHIYSDGYFLGAEELYIDEKTGKRYQIPSKCAEGITTFLKNDVSLGVGVNTDSHVLKEEDVVYKCKTSYAKSQGKPINTKDEPCTGDSSVIEEGTAISNSIVFKGRYKYFLGYINKTNGLTSEEIRELTTKQGWVNTDKDTEIVGGSPIVSNGQSIVIAIPDGYNIKEITNGLGASILPNFSTVEKDIVNLAGSATKSYKVYIYPITNGASVEFKNVKIGK